MPKKKKTLKQKMLADTRREREIESLYSFQLPVGNDQVTKASLPIKAPHAISTINYHYLGRDLRMTLLFTGAVVIAELVMNYFL